jgi:phosphatidylserine decarboxylase
MSRIPDVSPEVPSRPWRLILGLMKALPERGLSRAFGSAADIPLARPVRRVVLGSFARTMGIDLSEAELPLEEYPTLNAFFVRRLRQGVRSWPSSPTTLACPVDGVVGRIGTIAAGRAVQAKGHTYSVGEMLANGGEARRFEGGRFVTVYLSPRHYHRIHTPIPGEIRRATYVPGALYPVNAPAVLHVRGLFARNERLITYVDGALGRVAVVAVGAYNVGRISAAFDPFWTGTGRDAWVTNRRTPSPLERRYDPPVPAVAGEEIMAFHLGSTIVLLVEPGVELNPRLEPGAEIRVGEPLSA